MSICRKPVMPLPTLPDELVCEILLRLPFKPIGRFKCVAKRWRSLLSNPQFLRAHLELHIDDPEELILTSSSDCTPYILTLAAAPDAAGSSRAAANDGVARKVHLQFEEKIASSVVGVSCDGLVLLLLPNSRCRKMLFNPITLETAQIRDDRALNLRSCVYGFGYDSSSGDYKIVSLTPISGFGSFVDVYSLRMKSWKRIANSHYALRDSPFVGTDPAPGVYLNGCIHWFGEGTRDESANYEIVCFDLAREEFVVGLLPDSVIGNFAFDIRVFENCLALVCEPYAQTDSSGVLRMTIDVFVMREYGVRDSWTKFTAICPEEKGDLFDAAYNVVCVLNEDEIVLEKEGEQLLAYNRRSGVSRDLAISGLPDGFNRVMPFRGSLLSPN